MASEAATSSPSQQDFPRVVSALHYLQTLPSVVTSESFDGTVISSSAGSLQDHCEYKWRDQSEFAEKCAVFAMAVISRAMTPLAQQLSRGNTGYPYRMSTVVFSVCCIRVITCWAVVLLKESRGVWGFRIIACWSSTVIPGMMSGIGDALEAASLEYIDADSFLVLSQTRLLVLELFGPWILRRKWNEIQWYAVVSMLLGVVSFQKIQSGSLCQDVGEGSKQNDQQQHHFLLGCLIVFASVLLKGISSLLWERVIKEKQTGVSFTLKYTLYSCTLLLGSFAFMIAKDGISPPESFFEGWSRKTLLVAGALLLRMVMSDFVVKVLSAMASTFVNVLSLIVGYFVSLALSGRPVNTLALVQALMVCQAVLVYMRVGPVSEARVKAAVEWNSSEVLKEKVTEAKIAKVCM